MVAELPRACPTGRSTLTTAPAARSC